MPQFRSLRIAISDWNAPTIYSCYAQRYILLRYGLIVLSAIGVWERTDKGALYGLDS